MSVGQRLKARRKELGISVDELASMLGKNRATIYRYESEEIENMPISIVPPLAKALHITTAYIMGWDDEPLQAAKKNEIELDDEAAKFLEIFKALTPENQKKFFGYAAAIKDMQQLEEEVLRGAGEENQILPPGGSIDGSKNSVG